MRLTKASQVFEKVFFAKQSLNPQKIIILGLVLEKKKVILQKYFWLRHHKMIFNFSLLFNKMKKYD